MRRRVRIGALGIVDEQHVAAAADLFHAMRETREAAQAVLQRFAFDAERQRAAAQRTPHSAHCAARAAIRCRRSGRSRSRAPPEARHDAFPARHRCRPASGFFTETRITRLPACSMRSAAFRLQSIVDADDGRALLLDAGDKTLLHRGIPFERAVAIDMVLADVEQDADGRIERWREIDLVGRHLDDVNPAGARRLKRQDRGADVAAHLGVVTGERASECAISAVVVDLPLVPVIATNGASGAWRRLSRQKSSMSPITSTPACRAASTRPVRRRMGERRARRQHQGGEIRP